MTISLRISKEETELIKGYASIKNVSVSALFRSAVMEKIEDEYDLKSYHAAIKEFEENPVIHSLADVEKDLGLI